MCLSVLSHPLLQVHNIRLCRQIIAAGSLLSVQELVSMRVAEKVRGDIRFMAQDGSSKFCKLEGAGHLNCQLLFASATSLWPLGCVCAGEQEDHRNR